jgi:cytochrome c oxidase subunit 4
MSGHEMQGHTTDHTSVAEGHAHPTPKLYIQIAGILAVITLIEVFVLYLPEMGFEGFRPLLVPAFVILSVVKFFMVVGWYMHLRFDDPMFVRMFGFALLIALTVVTAFIALFHGVYLGL